MEVVEDAALLLRDGVVIDATHPVSDLIPDQSIVGSDWTGLREALLPRFPGIPASMPLAPSNFDASGGADLVLCAEPDDALLRLTVTAKRPTALPVAPASNDDQLVEAVNSSPSPMWRTGQKGDLIWRNAAYISLQELTGLTGVEQNIFELDNPQDSAKHTVRLSLTDSKAAQHWYEVTSQLQGDTVLHFATNINSLVEAEMAQRNFVQTLTKTFAHLPIGLAVFDKDRRLVLFNPALVDLTRLPADFLSARPNLLSFFDHMRENQMMPEPKNYATWRDQLAGVISAARDDRYCETWNLPSGLTYKITGRPHPDGAVAFLLEDISAEISLTRRFRSELELTQSVIDCFDDAVAVFSQLGVLTFCNAAYRALWSCDPDSTIAEMTIGDATRDWQHACKPSPIWPEIREFVLTLRDRAAWDATLSLEDGSQLVCTIEPVSAGATMVRFSTVHALDPVPQIPATAPSV